MLSEQKVLVMDIQSVNRLLDEINSDRSVPRNIRTSIETAKNDLNNYKQDEVVRISSAISILDEVSNDPNIPMYTRTQIWNIVSILEVMNEEVKKK
jgi:hypothetical protein